jgi:hypothetical protein
LQTQKLAAQQQLADMQQQIHLLQREAQQGLPPAPRHTRSHHRKH